MRKIHLVMSRTTDNLIGVNNDLVVHSKPDMKQFKQLTKGKFVLMGRSTCDSLPFKLPNRYSYVVTTQMGYESDKFDKKGPLDLRTINYLADHFYEGGFGEIYLIGGASLVGHLRDKIDVVHETLFNYSPPLSEKDRPVYMDPLPVGEEITTEYGVDPEAKCVMSGARIFGGVEYQFTTYTVKK